MGLLQHAAKVVRPGHRFVRRIIVVMTAVKDRDRFVRLNAEIRSDLYWWSEFVANWNGIGIIMNPDQALVKSQMCQAVGAVGQHGEHTGSNGNGTPQHNNGIYPPRSCYQYCWHV